MGGARDHLKSATLLKHDRLDRRLSELRLEHAGDYLTFLLLQSPVASLEAALDAAGVGLDLPDWPLRVRADALSADLASLGSSLPDVSLAPPDLTSAPARMGVAYVLEGSRLGAAVLRRAVHGSPDPRVRASSRFLDHGQGQDLWRRFQVRLEDALDTEPRRAAAGLAACWAFDAFLARVGPPCRPPLAIR